MSLRLVPLRDRVIIEPFDAPERTAGGLYLPENYQEKPREGHVRAVGPGRYENGVLIPMTLKVGDRVIYSKYAGTEVKHDGVEYVMIPEDNCNCVVMPKEEVAASTWQYECDCGEWKKVPLAAAFFHCECGKVKYRTNRDVEVVDGLEGV